MFGIAALDARRGVTISVSVVQYPSIVVSAAQGGYYIKLERWCRKARAKHVCAHCRQKRKAMQPVLSVNLTMPIVYAALRVSLRLVSPSSTE